jgi:4-amino-4-deoxy-L-arabinose transferase-like glycosyltransferase
MTSKDKPLQRRETLMLAGLVALAVALRLYKITQPFVDEWSFKQGTIAMIAENFYRNGFNILYPQINWAGPEAGYIGTEFPLMPYLASLLYVPFGVHEWIGRSLSVAFFAVSLPFLYLLVKKVSNERSAAFAGVIYAVVPLGIFAGRSFISDTTSLSFSVIALYLFFRWLERSDSAALLAAAGVTTGLAILVKLPNIIIGVPLLYLAWEKYRTGLRRQPQLWGFSAFALGLPAAWYLHAYLVTLHYLPHQFAGSDGIALADPSFYAFIARRLFTSSLTPLAAAGMLAGLFLPARAKYGRVFHWWLVAIMLFVIIAGHGNRHPWYQLPMVPVAAALAGRALDCALRKLRTLTGSRIAEWSAGVALFGALAAASFLYVKPLYDPWALPLLNAGHEIDRIASPDALVIYVLDGDSSGIYYGKRKGWHAFDNNQWGNPLDDREAIMGLEKLRGQGASYLLFTEYTAWWLDYYKDFRSYLDSHYRRTADTRDYVIFDLSGDMRPRLALSTPVSQCDREADCSQRSR